MTSSSKPNEVLVIYAGNNSQSGDISGYQCDYHVQSGTISSDNGIEVSSYYDMRYPCDKQPEQFVAAISSTVLTNLAEEFKLLPEGIACIKFDTMLPLWVIGVSSSPSDTLLNNVECQKLKTNDGAESCCVVVHAPMTFWWTDRDYQRNDILGVLSVEFNSPTATVAIDSDNVTIEYIGAFLETQDAADQGSIPPAASSPEGQSTQQSKRSTQLTMIGSIAVVAFGLLLLAAVALVVLQRRKRVKSRTQVEGAFGKSDDSHSDGPTLEVDVMSEGCDYPSNSQQMHHVPYSFEDDVANTPNSYTFDLANSMKLDVIGTYSGMPTCMAVVPPYPMEETSDSEVDSWAQTDGTVGSLEDRLEEITAEI
jgi:hypothetical protein